MNAEWIRYVSALYVQKIGSTDTDGFNADTGIRQGCPLSPVLFAIVADILLRKLQQELPNSTIRAFAADTAMVIDDMRLLPRIIAIFEEYAGFSNLGLNLNKTMVIPLTHGGYNIDSVKREVVQSIQSLETREKSARCISPRPLSTWGL